MFIDTSFDLTTRGICARGHVALDNEDLNRCSVQIIECSPISHIINPLAAEGPYAAFLANMVYWFVKMSESEVAENKFNHFRLSGLWGPRFTFCNMGLFSWRESGGKYYGALVSSQNQATAVISSMVNCERSKIREESYRNQVRSWSLPTYYPNHYWLIKGEIAKLFFHASTAYLSKVWKETSQRPFTL